MAFNVDALLIKRVRSVTFLNGSAGDVYFRAKEIESPSLSITSEGTTKNDAFGVPIATFYNGDTAEFSAENSLFSMGLLASQFGDTVHQASDTDKFECPAIEEIVVGATPEGTQNTQITLKQVPYGDIKGSEIKVIYIISKNKALGTKFTVGTVPSETQFTVDADAKTITLPTSTEITKDSVIFVQYTYLTSNAVMTEKASGTEPLAGKAVVEVMFCDPCDKNIEYFGYVVFGNAQLSPEVEWNIDVESTHGFTFTCQKDYCDTKDRLLYVIIPNDE